MVNPFGDEPVGQGYEGEYQQKQSAGFVVEEPRDEEQKDIAQVQSGTCLFTDYQGKDRIDYRKERPEVELGEEQR